jgi:hypothetical protein
MNKVTIETHAGEMITNVCQRAVAMAKAGQCDVEFQFNDQTLLATPESDAALIVQAYHQECERSNLAYLASPEVAARRLEAATKEEARKAKVAEILKYAQPSMTLANAELWEKSKAANTDPYGGGVITYAERWARMMEARMWRGETLEAVAEECSHLADEEGITGFMYGAAVSTLAAVWVNGEALRLWHNTGSQIAGEGDKANESGGVLNPAVLCVGGAK